MNCYSMRAKPLLPPQLTYCIIWIIFHPLQVPGYNISVGRYAQWIQWGHLEILGLRRRIIIIVRNLVSPLIARCRLKIIILARRIPKFTLLLPQRSIKLATPIPHWPQTPLVRASLARPVSQKLLLVQLAGWTRDLNLRRGKLDSVGQSLGPRNTVWWLPQHIRWFSHMAHTHHHIRRLLIPYPFPPLARPMFVMATLSVHFYFLLIHNKIFTPSTRKVCNNAKM